MFNDPNELYYNSSVHRLAAKLVEDGLALNLIKVIPGPTIDLVEALNER